jgi:hypothetical protein
MSDAEGVPQREHVVSNVKSRDRRQEAPRQEAPGQPGQYSQQKNRGRHGKKKHRAPREWATTTQGIFTVTATVVTLVFGGGGLVSVEKYVLRSNNSVPSINQVTDSLLHVSDVTQIYPDLTYLNKVFGTPTSCDKYNATQPQAAVEIGREFFSKEDTDPRDWEIAEDVFAYRSASDAHQYASTGPALISCLYGSQHTLKDVSAGINLVCDESHAWIIGVPDSNWLVGYATVRCGNNAVTIEIVSNNTTNLSEVEEDLFSTVQTAIPEIKTLPGS